jgi:peptidyl-prolyl cis-trans isomerase C
MVAPFSEAVAKLEKGKYTKAPIKTQFGWHIILLEDSRKQAAPPLEAVKEQLTPMLQRQKIQDMVEGLRKQAKVEMLLPKEAPAPAPAAVPATGTPPPAAAPAPAEAAKPAAEAPKPAEPAKAEPAKK